jgi:hypothetical protein
VDRYNGQHEKDAFILREYGEKTMLLLDNLKAAQAAGVQIKSYSMTETHRGVAWSLNVFLNGEKLGMVNNTGVGGADNFGFSSELQKKVHAALVQSGYKLDPIAGNPADVENWLGFALPQIGDELKDKKRYKKMAETGVLFEMSKEPFVGFFKIENVPAARQAVKEKIGDSFIRFLNDDFIAA